MRITAASPLSGSLTVPGDKSISHRSVMLGAISEGVTQVQGFLASADCLATIDCFRKMGVRIDLYSEEDVIRDGSGVKGPVAMIHGVGLKGLTKPEESLDAMNSGTTVRLLSGILAGQDFDCYIVGDESLSKRPMRRIMHPLTDMGALVISENQNNCLPLMIRGGKLHGIHYLSRVASAQVKSCVLLAGLYADTPTFYMEPALSRNHTELMLSSFGGNLKVKRDQASGYYTTILYPGTVLRGQNVVVPGDISSAAYFIAAALLVPGSEITLQDVGINETRDGILRVVSAMGGSVRTVNVRMEGREPVADLIVKSSRLTGTSIGGELIPTLIDELPVIAVMAACAEGKTYIYDAQELRVKESDRIAEIVRNLRAMGVTVEETEDGMVIEGRGGKQTGLRRKTCLKGAKIDPHGDHRIAMAFSVAGLVADGSTVITDTDCVKISYPDFYHDLGSLAASM